MTGDEAARYLLPETENRRIFLQEIVPEILEGRAPQDVPVVVFLVGQPGAGKSRVSNMIAATLNTRGGFVDVDSDLYKPYHPEYDNLMRQSDRLMAAYTRADGRAWMAQAHEYVREHRLNAVIQETSQSGASVADTMRAYRAVGFRVEVLALGVSEAMSNQGILSRYHEQVKDRGSGRLTVQSNADQSYTGILDLARIVDDERLADHVAVFRRGEGEPRYVNALRDGDWETEPRLREAIEAERLRPWSEHESSGFLRTQIELKEEMGPEWADELNRIDRLAEGLVSVPEPEMEHLPPGTPAVEHSSGVTTGDSREDGPTPRPSDQRLSAAREALEEARRALLGRSTPGKTSPAPQERPQKRPDVTPSPGLDM